ncbi:alpha/beta hydrolase [Streptomyces sp. NPDC002514]|uniref:alpha/beta hydrolase n=1 Tax=Streptomyces sp. NPDC001270 TaxID=3364554 RepID=UPI0036C6737A
MRKSFSLLLAVAAMALAGVPQASATTPPTTVTWGPCPADVTLPGLECSTVEVPLDYRHPEGRKIEIAISRLASKKPERRRGVLLTNPGGPGGTGLDFPALLTLGDSLPQSVRDTYDVIGFDPRGVGHSAPVTCDLTEEQKARGNFPPPPNTPADLTEQAAYAKTIAEQCATSRTAWLRPYITTANTARDMDRIRAALGEPKLSYDGVSYGTYLGAVYTTLFPQHSDRIVLDSSLGPGGYDVTAMRRFARGMQDRFPDFAAYAAAHPEYGLGSTPGQVTAKYYDLAARLDRKPVQGFDGTVFRGATFSLLYSDAQLPSLAATWQALDEDKPVPTSPGLPPTDLDNAMSSRFYVICGDSRWPQSVRTYRRDVAVDRLRYPMLGAMTANIGPCAFWPTDQVEPPVHIGDRGPSNVLMVQNLRDPGTPLAGARELRRALGDRARMVTADQGGHGVYPFGENACAKNAVTTFLTTGERPARDLACAAESHRKR